MRLFWEFLRVTLATFVLSYGVIYTACDVDGCPVAETRCENNRAEICNADQNWELNIDCSSISTAETWVCCWNADPAGHTCFLNECP